jgi:predicted RND superfamily exporter protein
MQSLLLSLVGVFVVATILGRSFRWGIYCVLPASLAVLVVLAGMGYLRMPLGVATSMFSGIVIGVGVDYAIHLLESWRRSAASGLTGAPLLEDAYAHTGPAIRIDALAVAAGFAVLLGSRIPANYRLAALVITSIVTCCLCTLLVFPLLLERWAPSLPGSKAPRNNGLEMPPDGC